VIYELRCGFEGLRTQKYRLKFSFSSQSHSGLRGTILAKGLSYLWRIGISRFSIRISSLRTLRLERGKRVGGEYVPATSIIIAKAFRLKAKGSNLANGIMKEVKETNL